MDALKDKVALVTGSTGGIGAAIAKLFASEGAKVAIHGIDREAGEATAKEIGDAQAAYFEADLEDPSACKDLVQRVAAHFGGLNILVNNAAVVPRTNLATTEPEIFDQAMRVNLRAPLVLIKAARPHFNKAGAGVVLNIGSVNAYCGGSELLDYSLTKGGLMTMTRNLGSALASEKIRVNQLNPGWVFTERENRDVMARGFPAGWHLTVSETVLPGGRLFLPEEIAQHALSLVWDRGGYVSGSVLDVNQVPMIGRYTTKAD